MPSAAAQTLVDIVRRTAETAGSRPAVTFVDYAADRSGVARPMSYAELDRRARAVAVRLRRSCPPGTRVALLCPHDATYLVAFLGCLYAGVIAVPLYAPETLRTNERLRAALRDSRPELVLTATAAREAVATAQRREFALPIRGLLCVDEVPTGLAGEWTRPGYGPDDVAYLQYTSGSTGTPSGVRVTHRNLLAVAGQTRDGTVAFTPESVLVGWVPFFHDLGLITGVVMPLAAGAHAVHLAPVAFIQEPFRWLDLISRYRASWTATPNFGLELSTRRVGDDQRSTLDLASLRVLLNGSEQVRPESWDAFLDRFAPCGLRAQAHSPGYGLAEATLGVTNCTDDDNLHPVGDFDRRALADGQVRRAPADLPAADRVRLVSCGRPFTGVRLAIVDPATRVRQPADRVGEVWVQGPNVAAGYWGQPERSAEVFGARLHDAPDDGPWLRTGDIGFLDDGQLYLAGRLKELIIIAGRNHYPADLEATAHRAHPAVRPDGVAAFGVEVDGEERLVVVAEVRGDDGLADVPVAIRRAIAERDGIAVHEVVCVRPGSVPRTTSRKVRRGECRRSYLDGGLARLAAVE